jgi:VRR-NUC domain
MRGVPDQIIVTPAITCFVETKSDNGSLRRQQIRVITHMRRSGAIVYTAYTRQEVDNIIHKLQLLNDQPT